MKYFICENEREGTAYHEFFKGKWDNTFWNPESILLHDDILTENRDFCKAIMKIVPEYDPYGVTEINQEQWIDIGEEITDITSKDIYDEATVWLDTVWEEYDCITLLGI